MNATEKISSYDATVLFTGSEIWKHGNVYDVNIHVMTDGRIQLFKSTKHFHERGMNLRIYKDVDEMFDDFSFGEQTKSYITDRVDSIRKLYSL